MCFVALFSFHAARSQVYTYQVKNEAALFKKIHFNDFDKVPTKVIPALTETERQRLIVEDTTVGRMSYRFATPIDVDFNAEKDGIWKKYDDYLIWSLKISADQASSISVSFNNFLLPDGAEMYFLSGDKKMLYGEITPQNSPQGGHFRSEIFGDGDILLSIHNP